MTRLLLYHCHLPFANFHLTASLWRACRDLPGVEAEIAQPYAIAHHLRHFRPDIVLAFGGESLTVAGVRALRPLTPKAVWALWTTEDPFEREVNIEAAMAFDYVFTSDAGSVHAYRHPRTLHLPLAADEALFYHPVVTTADALWYDLTFVGTAWPNRVTFLKELIGASHAASLLTRFVLPTNEFLPSETLETLGLARFERDYRVSPRDLALLQNRSRFALALFRDFSRFSDRPRPQSSPTNRFYETALAGTAQILVSREMDVARFYPELTGAVFPETTVDGILTRVLQARDDPGERNAAAERTQAFVRGRHLYRHRIAEILRHITGNAVPPASVS